MQTVSWFVKVVRSGARYEDGSLPAEVWREYEVCPTLNAFDNGDSRATTIIFYGNRVADIRLQDNKINTLQARMGTGGNNMPMVATIPIQGTIIGRADTSGPQGKGYGEDGDPMYTLDSVSGHGVAVTIKNYAEEWPQLVTREMAPFIDISPKIGTVRRLTPLECERLQGFPDGWTEGQADTHRYKQMGNAVAVPVVEWIIQGICDTI